MNSQFLSAVKARRTFYGISKETVITDEQLQQLIQEAVKHTPSAFNSQSARVVLLLGQQHDKLWNLTKEALKKVVPASNFAASEEKINSFQAGYASLLFLEDMTVVENLQKSYPLYKDNFPLWSLQSSGMVQHVIWTALEEAGYGASLQHYNPLIDESVKSEWNLPPEWKLLAQMPFGKPSAQPPDKEFLPITERVRVFK